MRQRLAVVGILALAALPLRAADSREREAAAILPQVQVSMETPVAKKPVAPLPIGTEYDMYCSGFIGPENQEWVGAVVSAAGVDAQSIFMETDIMYVDIGANRGVLPGQEFVVYRPDQVVYRYGSVTDSIGRIYQAEAKARVICVQDESSILELTRSCDSVEVGDVLLPFEAQPIPLVRRTRPLTSCEPGTGKVTGHIIEVKDRATPVGDKSVVYLDLGENEGLAPGDFFTVYRTRGQARGVRTILGELAVMKTQPHSAVAVVTSMNDVMFAGDEIEAK